MTNTANIDMEELTNAIAVLMLVSTEALRYDMVLVERVEAARSLFAALSEKPLDREKCNRLADRLLQVCAASEGGSA